MKLLLEKQSQNPIQNFHIRKFLFINFETKKKQRRASGACQTATATFHAYLPVPLQPRNQPTFSYPKHNSTQPTSQSTAFLNKPSPYLPHTQHPPQSSTLASPSSTQPNNKPQQQQHRLPTPNHHSTSSSAESPLNGNLPAST